MKRQIAAIEFGTSKIVTMIAQNSGLDRLDIIGSGTVPYDGYSEGDWNTPRQMVQRVRDSVAAAELEAGTKVSELYVGIPGEFIHVRVSEAEVDAPEGVIPVEAHTGLARQRPVEAGRTVKRQLRMILAQLCAGELQRFVQFVQHFQ